jgi:hypothetical protein
MEVHYSPEDIVKIESDLGRINREIEPFNRDQGWTYYEYLTQRHKEEE